MWIEISIKVNWNLQKLRYRQIRKLVNTFLLKQKSKYIKPVNLLRSIQSLKKYSSLEVILRISDLVSRTIFVGNNFATSSYKTQRHIKKTQFID